MYLLRRCTSVPIHPASDLLELVNGSVIAPRPEWPGCPLPPSSWSSSSPQGGPWPAIARGLGVLARGGGSRPALRMRELSPDQSFHRARGAGVALARDAPGAERRARSAEHTSELQSLMRTSYAVFCLKKKTQNNTILHRPDNTHKTNA